MCNKLTKDYVRCKGKESNANRVQQDRSTTLIWDFEKIEVIQKCFGFLLSFLNWCWDFFFLVSVLKFKCWECAYESKETNHFQTSYGRYSFEKLSVVFIQEKIFFFQCQWMTNCHMYQCGSTQGRDSFKGVAFPLPGWTSVITSLFTLLLSLLLHVKFFWKATFRSDARYVQ